jgi:hypothetical protein
MRVLEEEEEADLGGAIRVIPKLPRSAPFPPLPFKSKKWKKQRNIIHWLSVKGAR